MPPVLTGPIDIPFETAKAVKAHEVYLAGRPNGRRLLLKGANLNGKTVDTLDLRRSILTGASFIKAHARVTNFGEADLFGCDFSQADLQSANFERADLRGANFAMANLSGAILRGADMRPGHVVNWGEEEKRDTNFTDANLDGADFTGSNMSEANLAVSSARGAIFRDVVLHAVNLAGANLSGADLSGCNLKNANLTGTNLDGANLKGANLADANLRNVDLSKAILDNTNLMGAIHRDTEHTLPDDIEQALRFHSTWIASNGRTGMRAEFVGRDLRGLDFELAADRGEAQTQATRHAPMRLGLERNPRSAESVVSIDPPGAHPRSKTRLTAARRRPGHSSSSIAAASSMSWLRESSCGASIGFSPRPSFSWASARRSSSATMRAPSSCATPSTTRISS